MPKSYPHLTYEQRCLIFALLQRECSQSQIAKDLKVDQSSISREISHNKGKRGYRYKQAQRKDCKRRINASTTPHKMTLKNIKLIEQMIGKQRSPDQIRRIGIEQRSAIVEQKSRVEDFEADTIIGAQYQGAIVSLVEHKTKLTRLGLVSRTTAQQTKDTIVKLLAPIKKHVHTMTTDNGKKFAKHKEIAKELKVNVYFANPYHAWERGLNENTNGLVRQYFPKKHDFTTLTHEQVQNVEYLLNTRPRKSLGYQTPIEVFLQLIGTQLNYALQS